jgi:hypothetical protein
VHQQLLMTGWTSSSNASVQGNPAVVLVNFNSWLAERSEVEVLFRATGSCFSCAIFLSPVNPSVDESTIADGWLDFVKQRELRSSFAMLVQRP